MSKKRGTGGAVRSRSVAPVGSDSCQHHWHSHGTPAGFHAYCCRCGAGVEVVGEDPGEVRAFFYCRDDQDPPRELVRLVERAVGAAAG